MKLRMSRGLLGFLVMVATSPAFAGDGDLACKGETGLDRIYVIKVRLSVDFRSTRSIGITKVSRVTYEDKSGNIVLDAQNFVVTSAAQNDFPENGTIHVQGTDTANQSRSSVGFKMLISKKGPSPEIYLGAVKLECSPEPASVSSELAPAGFVAPASSAASAG